MRLSQVVVLVVGVPLVLRTLWLIWVDRPRNVRWPLVRRSTMDRAADEMQRAMYDHWTVVVAGVRDQAERREAGLRKQHARLVAQITESERAKVASVVRSVTSIGVDRGVGDTYDVRFMVDRITFDKADPEAKALIVEQIAAECAQAIADGVRSQHRTLDLSSRRAP
jgi:hypothetical protein